MERFSFQATVVIDGREMRIPVFAEGGAFETRSAQVQYIVDNFYIDVSGSAPINHLAVQKAIGASRLIENLVRVSFSELYGFDNRMVQEPTAHYEEQAAQLRIAREGIINQFDYLQEGNINLVEHAIDTTLDEISIMVLQNTIMTKLGVAAASTAGVAVSVAAAGVSIAYAMNAAAGRSADILAAQMTASSYVGLKVAHLINSNAIAEIGNILARNVPSAQSVREAFSSGTFSFDDISEISRLSKLAKEADIALATMSPLFQSALEAQIQEEEGQTWYGKLVDIFESVINVWLALPQPTSIVVGDVRDALDNDLGSLFRFRLLESIKKNVEIVETFERDLDWVDFLRLGLVSFIESGNPIGSTGEAIDRLRDVQGFVSSARIAEAIHAVESRIFTPDNLAAEGDFFAQNIFPIYELIAQSLEANRRVNLGTDDGVAPDTGELPNLLAHNLSVSEGSVEPGGRVSISFNVSNIGDAVSRDTFAGVYISSTSEISTSDIWLSGILTPSIQSGSSREFISRSISLPENLNPGNYWIGVIADYDNRVEESNELNNASAGVLIIVGAPSPTPDTGAEIRLRHFNLDESSVEVGERLFFEFGLQNTGTEMSRPFHVAFYVTQNQNEFENPIFFFEERVNGIDPSWGRVSYLDWWVRPDGYWETGDYYLALVVDSRNEIEADSNTWNIHYEPLRIIGEEPNTPASISGAATGLVVEDDAERQIASGSLTVDDPDPGEDRFAEISSAALTGDYGSFAFDPQTGAWTYTLDNDLDAVQSLPEGAEVSDSLSVISFDGTASETITVIIRGVNDPATISGTRNATLDLRSGDWDHPVSSTEFTLLSEERFPVSSDFNAIIQQELGSQAQLADWVDIKVRYELEGGGFLREAGLVPRDEDGINGGAVTRDGARFLSGDRHYFISWGDVHSGFASHDIAWYDGDPLHLGSWYTDQRLFAFSGEQEPSDGQLPGLASVSGQLLVIDPDAGEDRFRPVDPDALLGEFGTFSFNPETGAWSYVLDVAAIGADTSSLNGAVETLTVTSLDGTASETVTVDLIAAEPTENTPASIAGDSTGLVVEDDADRQQATGVLSVTDPDAGEDRFAEVDPATLAGDYGSFAFDPETGAWSYTLDNDLYAVQALPEGAEVTDSLSVISFDGTASETITVTIRGVNDPASISGDTTGLVIEDDPEAQLVSGRLIVTDPDQGEDRFRPRLCGNSRATGSLPLGGLALVVQARLGSGNPL